MAVINKFAKPTVLVTGATGAIGRAVCRDLVVNGYLVMGLVRNEEAKLRLPYAVIPTIGDIRDPRSWEHALEQCDIVVNLAFHGDKTPGPREQDVAEREARALADILDRVAAACRRHKKLLIHTFGLTMYEPDPDGWVRESSDISQGRGFGIRHKITYPVFDRHRKRGLRAMSVNPAFVYGRGGWFEDSMLRPMTHGTFRMFGDGSQNMHYIEASDAASGYRLAIERGLTGDDYLLADDQPTTLAEFATLVAKELGVAPPRETPLEELIPELGSWTVEAYTTCPKVDSSRARERLGWAPRYRTIHEGVPVVVRAYRRALHPMKIGQAGVIEPSDAAISPTAKRPLPLTTG